MKYKARVFKIHGYNINCDFYNISFDEETGKLQITSGQTSPIQKMAKINTPTKSVHKKLFSEIPSNKMDDICRENTTKQLQHFQRKLTLMLIVVMMIYFPWIFQLLLVMLRGFST